MSSYSKTSGVDRSGTGLVSAGRTQRAAAAKAAVKIKGIATLLLSRSNNVEDIGLYGSENWKQVEVGSTAGNGGGRKRSRRSVKSRKLEPGHGTYPSLSNGPSSMGASVDSSAVPMDSPICSSLWAGFSPHHMEQACLLTPGEIAADRSGGADRFVEDDEDVSSAARDLRELSQMTVDDRDGPGEARSSSSANMGRSRCGEYRDTRSSECVPNATAGVSDSVAVPMDSPKFSALIAAAEREGGYDDDDGEQFILPKRKRGRFWAD